LATDSGESNGLSTGSVQNLRGELGIGASHKCSDSTLVFGELSFVGDMVRNNPTADLGGMRLRGSNPGRAGINLSVGAAHRLSDDWSLNASYSFELMQNVTSHSLNVGASYSF
ncbi:MAG: autotransporter domain-containing protein, partial [Akkermansia sp.]|nr:autotransporter domain-containing protein [Akkermansia sp.]